MISSCRPVQFEAVGDHKGFVVAERWAALKTPDDKRRSGGGKGDLIKHYSSEETSPPISPPVSDGYLSDLRRDLGKLCELDPLDIFPHAKNLLRHEIERAVALLPHTQVESVQQQLPPPVGPIVKLSEKLFVPVKEFPDYNFAGRILGPRGMTVKQLEQETGCKIMVKGRKGEGKQSDGQLHVVVSVEDTEGRALIKLQRGVTEVSKLLRPNPDGTDELKRKQLMEVAIINGTYRPPSHRSPVTYVLGNMSPPKVFFPGVTGGRPIQPRQPAFVSPPVKQPMKGMSPECMAVLTQLGIDMNM